MEGEEVVRNPGPEAVDIKTESTIEFSPVIESNGVDMESETNMEQPPLKKPKLEGESGIKSSEPIYEMVGGSTLRQYLNKHLTEHLLEGIRIISKEKPVNPLKRLGEYLIEVSEKQ
ncbi:COMPASS (complex proteins associated with Set1p) component [Scheffersomyces spartinae]|uniref:COMPASS (Complex proteins associated with Set1p) component n=1 Tax=Scheffersomyces spartinae TaxID=45513 RepID=A0A9P7VCZ8_9ASCO|nr:COMPASS (complex proteins associated with Set1p) component [Scheffersomyces spartinae]KAG7195532.1 COMPASS (complex proteins associated with Set1p) component [Scheffersomyces spartinae]